MRRNTWMRLGAGMTALGLVISVWGGAARAGDNNGWQVGGVVVGTFQHTGQSNARSDWGASADVAAQLPLGPGLLQTELKGNTTPRTRGVTGILGEANDTMGETLNRHDRGRAAVTQLFYGFHAGPGKLSLGLLDATANIDDNGVADTEYTQFMGSSFVHNPTIQFPSFALGANYLYSINDDWRVDFLLSSTAGLEDRPNPNYSHVLSPFSNDQGPFGAIELQGAVAGIEGNLGVWANGSDNAHLRSGTEESSNYGAYTNVVGPILHRDKPGDEPKYVIRLGIARESVSPASDFEAAAVSIPFSDDQTLGIGIARTAHRPIWRTATP